MTRIDAPDDPYPLEKGKRKTQLNQENEPMEGEVETKILQTADPSKQVMKLKLFTYLNWLKMINLIVSAMRFINFSDEIQESLQAENIPDPMDAEQTWPTEEELKQAEAQQKRKLVKVVPKGTSEYQAAWIPDEDAG